MTICVTWVQFQQCVEVCMISLCVRFLLILQSPSTVHCKLVVGVRVFDSTTPLKRLFLTSM